VLATAGLGDVTADLRTYRHVFAVGEYVSGWGGLSRYLRAEAGEERWRNFADRAAAALRECFGTTITSVKRVWIATGTNCSE
jgi:hypothetical protein